MENYSLQVSETTPSLDETPILESIEHQYSILTGHVRRDGTYKTTDQLHSEYVSLTDKLVYQMTEGVEVKNSQTGEREIRRPDVVVWLDKSARPLAWLTSELWDTLAAEEDGTVPPKPDFAFVNIDRQQWVNDLDPMGNGRVDMDRVADVILRSLRSIFISPTHKRQGLTEAIDDMPASLDGKTVLIVDEVKSSGETLGIAERFFAAAFPTAAIATTHWMAGVKTNKDAVVNKDDPVWYRGDTTLGRGVGERNPHMSKQPYNHNGNEAPRSLTQYLGAWFLSTALEGPDELSVRLRQEIKWLGQDVRAHKVLIRPYAQRDDLVDRIVRLNKMPVEEYISAKHLQDNQTM